MFRNDLQVKKTGSITIDDMDSKVLKELLNFIYTDRAIPKEMAADLFLASKKYALLALQKMCENMLIETMSADTVVDILLLCHRHASERLKSVAVQFAIKNIKTEFSDVTLVAKDGIGFKVHKVVLCARSEVFADMFRNDLQVKKTGSITIDDMDSKVLNEFLNFIYTDGAIPKEMAADLFLASKKYALLALQKKCENMLIETMSADTVGDILLLCDRHASERLKSMAVHFAIKNIKTVSATESWKRLRVNDRALCMDILEKAMQERL
ncbi:protein roadkill-like [Musca vetustissima]|uniref:protein roadkill-like n=1 Tax=Musca vetustissima TaxID=27455 RepID=UPI002AB69A00|nr:protein roadkill-like [Musca vetustissima]